MDELHGQLPGKKKKCRSNEITQAKACLKDKIMEQEYFILNYLIQSYIYIHIYIEADVYLI